MPQQVPQLNPGSPRQATQQIPNTNLGPPKQTSTHIVPNNIHQGQNLNSNPYKWNSPLTGANTVPLPQRDAREMRKTPLLPTPRDPFQDVQRNQPPRDSNGGARPKNSNPQPQKTTTARHDEASPSAHRLDQSSEDLDDPASIADTPPHEEPLKSNKLPERYSQKHKGNYETSQTTTTTKNRFEILSQITENISDTEQNEEDELPSFWSPQRPQKDKKTREEEVINQHSMAPKPEGQRERTPSSPFYIRNQHQH